MERTPVYGEPQQKINFEGLPTDVLFTIFDYLDIQSLSVLCSVCKRFYNIINDEYLNVKSFSLLVTNQFSDEVQKRYARKIYILMPPQDNKSSYLFLDHGKYCQL